MGGSTSSIKIPLWIDCDPGHDDALAILMAAYHPQLELLGISTVHGNSSLANTTQNALSVLDAIGKPDIPVIPGASRPFCRAGANAEDYHGASGLAGTDLLPEPKRSVFGRWNAVDEMRRALLATAKGTAWLIAIGPLTNIALLFTTYPELATHIKGISIMGGAIGNGFPGLDAGNGQDMICHATEATFYAEFNIWCDPESARNVFLNPVLQSKTVLIPLDLTHQACVADDVRQRLLRGRQGATKLRTMFYELIVFYGGSYARDTDLKSGPPLHDALAVAAPMFDHVDSTLDINSSVDKTERWSIDVVLDGEQTGRTMLTRSDGEGSIVPRTIDATKLWAMLESCMARADEATGYQRPP